MGLIDWARSLFTHRKSDKVTTPAGTIEKVFGVRPAVSREMEKGINLWWDLYTGQPSWASCDVRPLGLPRAIGRELARTALTEFSVAVSGSQRAEYLNRQMQTAAVRLGENLEMGLCLGGVCLRPYPDNGRILVDAFTTRFSPTRFDGTGKAVGGVFESEPVRQGKEWFVRLEYHDLRNREDGSTLYVMENLAFKSGSGGGIGDQVPLASVEAWAGLAEHTEIENLEGPLFAYFKQPSANDVDPSSPVGASVYAGPTVDLIRQADEQWEMLRWAYSVAQPKIFAEGTLDPGQVSDRVFVHGTFTNGNNLFQIFDPAVKDDAYYRGYQNILRQIESNVGLAFGIFSDPQSVEKTATEIHASKQRQRVTEKAIQMSLQAALDGLINAMDAWCDLAQLVPAGDYQTAFNWGDGVLDDPDTRRQDMAMGLSLLNAGIIGPVEYRMRYFGEDEKTARKMLPDMEDMTEDDGQNEIE